MGQFRYRVQYLTSESLSEVEEVLRQRCRGDWDVHETKRRRERERHDFLVSFEREGDIGALLRPATHAR